MKKKLKTIFDLINGQIIFESPTEETVRIMYKLAEKMGVDCSKDINITRIILK